MRFKLAVPIASLYVLLLTTAFQCGEYDEPAPAYTFQESIDLYPEQKRYRLGDTLWLEYRNPGNTLVDQRTNQPVAVDSVSLRFPLNYTSRYEAPVSPAGGFCEFVTATGGRIAGYTSPYNTAASLEVGCDASRSFRFKVGVVPKHKGVYSLDLPVVPQEVRACPTRRTGFPRSTIVYRFTAADGNKDVYLAIPPHQRGESVKGTTEQRIEDKIVFVLKVE